MRQIIVFLCILMLITVYSCNTKKAETKLNTEISYLSIEKPKAEKTYIAEANPMAPRDKMDYNLSDVEETPLIIDISKIDKKKIIKDGNISIKVNDIENTKKAIDQAVKINNAYYENEDFQNSGDKISYELIIRIPSDNFEKLLLSIENGNGEVTVKNIRARDVTEEYIDLASRLNNKKLYLTKYNELLTKAKNVKDIIEIQENIRNLQEEIESTEGRLKYLNDQIAYSTLNVNIYKQKEYTYKPQKQDSFFERFKASLNNGWTSVVDFILLLIQNWAFLIVIALIIVIIRRLVKKRKRKE